MNIALAFLRANWRYVAGGALVIALVLAILWWRHSLLATGDAQGAARIQAAWNADKLARARVVNAQLQSNAEELARQIEANAAAQRNLHALQTRNADLGTRLADSLRAYADLRTRSGAVPAAAADPAKPADPTAEPGGAGEAAVLAGLAGEAVKACYSDAAQLQALLDTLK